MRELESSLNVLPENLYRIARRVITKMREHSMLPMLLNETIYRYVVL